MTHKEHTIAQSLDWAKQQLSSIDTALLDAKVLLCFCLDKPVVYLHTWPERVLSTEHYLQFNHLVNQRKTGIPVAHLTGSKEFWSLDLKVNPSTLIPRPETEHLVEQVLDWFPQQELRVLDLGTGTGAIALALASERPNWHISAVDFSNDAVALAKENARNLNLDVDIFQSDWFTQIPRTQFDLIVSNPPYIEPDSHWLTEGDVRFEPLSALIAENDGMADIEQIVKTAKGFLAPKGRLIVEHGYQQGQTVRECFHTFAYQQIETHRDLAGLDRLTSGYLQFS